MTCDDKRRVNFLINEKSPYLLQHAYNPVEWHPWKREALDRAEKEDKPIFLSIGYSTCHWCHVMEKESYEDDKIAETLNNNFICIKVDREERPDIDEFYMKAVQQLTGSGGWPLNVFLTPDLDPFYGGTYFPPEPRYGIPSFIQILELIVKNWKERRKEIKQNSKKLAETLKQTYEIKPGAEGVEASILQEGYERLTLLYDQNYKGFSSAPKFPMPNYLSFLLRHKHREEIRLALKMVTSTLEAMAQGGIYDQLAGGFHRYSTDRYWRVPHFEKMLYDNALLATLYMNTYLNTGDPFHARITKEVLDWILDEMIGPKGGFYSAMDADVNGDEGSYYLWTYEEVYRILGKKLGEEAAQYYGITQGGNFEGRNILYCRRKLEELPSNKIKTIQEAKKILLNKRRKRKRPQLDDKIITGWNGLSISAMALGYRVMKEKRFLEAAESTANLITHELWQNDQLYRYYREGRAEVLGFLEDYAYLVSALIDLYETTFNPEYLKTGLEINESMLHIFLDKETGGFYDTSKDSELPVRIKNVYDGDTPSGNSIAIMNLLRLAELTGRNQYRKIAEKTILAFKDTLEETPESYTSMLSSIDAFLNLNKEIVIAASRDEIETEKVIDEIWRHYIPNKVVALVKHNQNKDELQETIPMVKGRIPIKGATTVYICENFSCKKPITSLSELKTNLHRKS